MLKGKAQDGMIDIFSVKESEQKVFLYNKLTEYAMYWQYNTPTSFGNPDFKELRGWVFGFLSAKKWQIKEYGNKIIVRNNSGKKIIEMETLPLPKSYYEAKKEVKEVWEKFYEVEK